MQVHVNFPTHVLPNFFKQHKLIPILTQKFWEFGVRKKCSITNKRCLHRTCIYIYMCMPILRYCFSFSCCDVVLCVAVGTYMQCSWKGFCSRHSWTRLGPSEFNDQLSSSLLRVSNFIVLYTYVWSLETHLTDHNSGNFHGC